MPLASATGSEAVSTGDAGIGGVVDLAEVARALDEALALQRADVAAQVVGEEVSLKRLEAVAVPLVLTSKIGRRFSGG
ncbi:MAG: hypothetical protein IPH16_14445 [Haliscomenobacter sp.]|nr:hypothetical protein [Haliscomenobacter sp.]